MFNFPTLKKEIELENTKVVISDLSIGFISAVEDGSINETMENVLTDASNLSKEQIKALRRSEAGYLCQEIVKLTYGENIKEEDGDGDTKK